MRKIIVLLFIALTAISLTAQTKGGFGKQPDFTATTMEGKNITLSDLRGKVVVLNLWFINCPNCLSEIKALNQLFAEYKDNPDVVFLAPAASKKADLVNFLKKNPFSFQVIPDAMILILDKFGTSDKNGQIHVPFPMHYVLDREGNIVVKVEGTKGVEAVKTELKRQFMAKTATVK